jgi:hypothetical protein
LKPKKQQQRHEPLNSHVKKPLKQLRKQSWMPQLVQIQRHRPAVEGYSRILFQWDQRVVEVFRRLEVCEVEEELDEVQVQGGHQAQLEEKLYEDEGHSRNGRVYILYIQL